MTPDLETIQWLRSSEGEDAIRRAQALQAQPLHRVVAQLRQQLPPARAAAALEMAQLRARARSKFSLADQMLFTAEALEQSSGELVAAHTARRFDPDVPVLELCCGIGGDLVALARQAAVLAVDRDPVRLACAERNLEVAGVRERVLVQCGAADDQPPGERAVFIDPSRRSGGRRLAGAEQASPPLTFVTHLLLKARGGGAKLSPALSDQEEQALMLHPLELESVSLNGVCREVVSWSGDRRRGRRRATAIRGTVADPGAAVVGELTSDADCDVVAAVAGGLPCAGDLLVEPDAAVIRAHLVGTLAHLLGMAVIDPQIAYLVGDHQLPACQAGSGLFRSYRVLDCLPFSEKRVQGWLTARGVGALTVKKRGFPLTAEEVHARLRLKGEAAATLVLTRQGTRRLALFVEPVQHALPE